MKSAGLFFASSLLIASSAFSKGGVVYDAQKKTVSFDVVSTDCGVDTELEFLFVGPDSDHDYESMFTTVAPVSEIVDAFDKAGFPSGSPMSKKDCRFWATGGEIVMEPAFTNLVKDFRVDRRAKIIYTGGTRNANGTADAAQNMPAAVFALYNCPQSPIVLDDFLEQSATYGRFKVAEKIPKGELRRVTFRYVDGSDHKRRTLEINATNLVGLARSLKAESERSRLDVLCRFSSGMTVKSARDAARLLQMIDSPDIKINGVEEGQLYYRAYLPLEKWRDRKERLMQPPEVRFKADGSVGVTVIKEDWSDENSLDPRLTAVEKTYADVRSAAEAVDAAASKVRSVLFFAPETEKLGKIFEVRKNLKTPNLNIYVFME